MVEAGRLLEGRRAVVTGASRITGATLTIDGGKLAGTPAFNASR